MFWKLALIMPALCLGWQPVLAAGDTADSKNVAEVKKMLADLVPGRKPDSIIPAPIPGFYEVSFNSTVIYVSQDGRYALEGDLLDLKSRRNLTEDRRSVKRLAALSSLSEDKMIIFAPKEVKHTITVFTDIDCGYCRKLHSQISQFNAEGIKVRYIAFPRDGLASPSYEKAVSVWCAADRNTALTRAKLGQEIEPKKCDNPVKMEYELGRKVGVTGTPAIVLEDGSMLPGYIPPQQMALMLDMKKLAHHP